MNKLVSGSDRGQGKRRDADMIFSPVFVSTVGDIQALARNSRLVPFLALPLSCSTEGGGGEKADTSLTTIVDSRRGRTLGEKECLFPVSSLFFLQAYLKC